MKCMKKNFLMCGVMGWCMEILFTSSHCFLTRDAKLMGQTSLWMFPIYGLAACIYPLNRFLKKFPVWIRGLIYSGGIFSVEYVTGTVLNHFSCCPWNYDNAKYNVNGVIRLDYLPFWAIAGLLFERLLLRQNASS